MKLIVIYICILVLTCFNLIGCKKINESILESEKILEINKSESAIKEAHKKNNYEIRDSDVAEIISYNYQDRSMYIAGLKIFKEFSTEEFGFSNEGNIKIIKDESALEFQITTATGTTTGALDGPYVYFKMNLDTNEIIDKEFRPAPNYADWGKPEFIKHSEEVIELTDERMAEIGKYFKELIMHIEENWDVTRVWQGDGVSDTRSKHCFMLLICYIENKQPEKRGESNGIV